MDCVQKHFPLVLCDCQFNWRAFSPSYHYFLYMSIKGLSFIFCDPLWFMNLALQHDLKFLDDLCLDFAQHSGTPGLSSSCRSGAHSGKKGVNMKEVMSE